MSLDWCFIKFLYQIQCDVAERDEVRYECIENRGYLYYFCFIYNLYLCRFFDFVNFLIKIRFKGIFLNN